MRDLLDVIANAESGGNINARSNTPLSDAQGLFGFTTAAFKQVQQDHPDLRSVTKEQWAVDPQLQRTFADRLKQRHERILAGQGIDVNPVSLYANWHFGEGGGPKFLKSAPNTRMEDILDPIAIAANPHLQGKTQAQIMELFSKKMGTALPNAVSASYSQGNTAMNPNQTSASATAYNPQDPASVYQYLMSQQTNVPVQQLTPQQKEALLEGRQQRAGALPLAIAASLAGDKRVSGMGQQLYKDSMGAQGAMQLGNEGWLTADGQFIQNPFTDAQRTEQRGDRMLNLAVTSARSAQDRELMNMLRAQQITAAQTDNAPANAVPGVNGTSTLDVNAPWSNLTNKQAGPLRASTLTNAQKQLAEMREATQGDAASMQMMDQFLNLNSRESTGGLIDKFGPESLKFGDTAAMLALQKKMTPLQRPPGSGATSDFEQKMYALGIPNISNDFSVNQQTRMANAALTEVRSARLKHYEEYLAKYGHLNGVDSSFAPLIGEIEKKYQSQINAISKARKSALPRATAQANGTSQQPSSSIDALLEQYK
jgi:hypothetical protein